MDGWQSRMRRIVLGIVSPPPVCVRMEVFRVTERVKEMNDEHVETDREEGRGRTV